MRGEGSKSDPVHIFSAIQEVAVIIRVFAYFLFSAHSLSIEGILVLSDRAFC